MPLVGGRAGQYAGWWSGKPNFSSTSLVTMTNGGTWNGYASLTPNYWSSPYNGDNLGSSFDGTGLPSSANKGVMAMTIRFQAASGYTFSTDTYRTDYQNLNPTSSSTSTYTPATMAFYQAGTETYWQCTLGKTVSGSKFSIHPVYGGYDYFDFSDYTWDDLANRWITIIVAYSSSSSDFANWTGGTTGSNIFSRMTLCDAQTGLVLQSRDVRWDQFGSYNQYWGIETWQWTNQTPTGGASAGTKCTTASATLFNDVLLANYWVSMAQVIDPTGTTNGVTNASYLCGQNLPKDICSATAWVNFGCQSSTTNGSNQDLLIMNPCRVTTTSNLFSKYPTSLLTSPYTNSAKP